jgi:mono/diheme cytochrome c family protein
MRILLFLALACLASGQVLAQEQSKVDFNRDVRPILSDKCYACHGPDGGQRKSDWRLDQPLPADSEIIVPGDPGDSLLVQRILTDDKLDVMPPAGHRKKLSETEKQTLVKWIEQGANWKGHWAFEKVQAKQHLPHNENVVDHWITKRLDELALSPAPTADRRTLIRRAYFDLIGLPPTPEQVKRFVEDSDDGAFQKVVDELLASRHFGERMAVYWLDLVRYADTVGYHGDQDISVSPYRDYVIEAFNKNMPFDQFTREQLAGDLLEKPTQQQLIASGYNRLGMMSAEGGVQPKEYLAKYAAERVRTTSTVWLGMTLGCAECHDHKFDPFTIEDFYSFASFFADIKERGLYSGANQTGDWGPMIEVAEEGQDARLKPFDETLASLRKSLNAKTPEIRQAQELWESKIADASTNWTAVSPKGFSSYSGVTHRVRKDHSILISGKQELEDTYLLSFELPPGTTTRGIRIEALPDKSLPRKGPGRAGNGNFVITELILSKGDQTDQLETLKKVHDLWPEEMAAKRVDLKNASADFEQASTPEGNPYGKWAAESAIDRDVKGSTWGWAINGQNGKPHELVVQLEQPLASDETPIVTLTMQQYHGTNHELGCFRISFSESEFATVDWSKRVPAEVLAVIQKTKADRTEVETQTLDTYYRNVAPELESVRAEISKQEKSREAVRVAHTRKSPITVRTEPREMRVLARGNWMDTSGEVVEPKVPMMFRQIEKQGRADRLDLANWILDNDNPLTARVYVNRVWKLFFGAGLSKVLDDLGSQGELPSHPELLESLASQFVESGWDTKALIRMLVLSKVYQQSSAPREELAIKDPFNRLVARQSRFRLDAEFVRDNALKVSGLLVEKVGGRSTKPYQPEGLYRHLNFPKRKYKSDQGDDQYRRGLYTHWQRQFLHPAMKTFDAPSREECTCERPRSNTPLGALVMLNDPSFVEAARGFATSMLEVAGLDDDRSRIQWLVEQALSRKANEREVEVLASLLDSHRKQFASDEQSAKELLSIGLSKAPVEISVVELAAWTSVARTIMNLHEFIVRN